LIGISFAWKKEEAYYLPVGTGLDLSLLQQLKQVLADEKIKKVGHNLKFDLEILETAGFQVKGLYFDTMIASYLLNPGTRQHGLDNLAFVELGYRTQSIEDLAQEKNKTKIDLSKIAVEQVANYSCEDADITWRLYEKLEPKIETDNLLKVLEDIEDLKEAKKRIEDMINGKDKISN